MAHLLDRKWLGSEVSDEYVRIANERLAPYRAESNFAAAD
jgi:DNA modification methylase